MAAWQEIETASSATVEFGTGTVELLIIGIDLDAMTDRIDRSFAIIAMPFGTGQVKEDFAIENFIACCIATGQQAIVISIKHL